MAQTSWPFYNQDTDEDQFTLLFRHFARNGVFGQSSDTALKVFADSTGMQVKVPVGFAIVRGLAYNNSAQETLVIEAANASPRHDLIVLRLDPDIDSIVLAVKKGTAAASPADPSLTTTDTGVFEIPLARVLVSSGVITIAADKITDLRTFTGLNWGSWTTERRPTSPRRGEAGFNTTTGLPEYWTGSAWATFMPSTFTGNVVGNVTGDVTGKVNGITFGVGTELPASPADNTIFFKVGG